MGSTASQLPVAQGMGLCVRTGFWYRSHIIGKLVELSREADMIAVLGAELLSVNLRIAREKITYTPLVG
jgi:hypothetical protein